MILKLLAGRFHEANEVTCKVHFETSAVEHRTLRAHTSLDLMASVLVRKDLSALVPHAKHGMDEIRTL